jgi:integrase
LRATGTADPKKAVTRSGKQRSPDRDAEPWTPAEVTAFLTGIRSDRDYAVFLLSLIGLRPEEVCGLRWADVELDAAVPMLTVTQARTLVEGESVEKDAKTQAGARGLPLPGPLARASRVLRLRQAEERLAAGDAYRTDDWYVYADDLGEPGNTAKLRRRAYVLMRRHGLRMVRLYDARHSCLTYLAAQGVSDVVLARWAGHTNAAFTKSRYVHLTSADLGSAVTALDTFLG